MRASNAGRAALKTVGLGLALTLVPTLAASTEPRAQRGRNFQCHAIGPVGDSPLRIAPPFRKLHERYPVETLAEALAEGIVTGHPSMPEFRLDVAQINDLIAYLKSLEGR
jgi:cytochrome c